MCIDKFSLHLVGENKSSLIRRVMYCIIGPPGGGREAGSRMTYVFLKLMLSKVYI
jgi:hypothetical protein